MKKLWAGWKVALLWVGIVLVALFVIGFVVAASGANDPEKTGEEIGRTYGVALVFAPIVAYVVQKMRIDHANRPAARRAQRDQQQPPPTA